MLTLVVRFTLPGEDAVRAFDALTATAVPLIRSREPGTLVYETHTVDDDPLGRVFYEVYADDDALAAHESTTHTRAFLQGIRALVTDTRVERLRAQYPVSGGRPAGAAPG